MTVPSFSSAAEFRDWAIKRHADAMVDKYDVGQDEHGGLLYEYGLLFLAKSALEENYDQGWYLQGLVHRLTVLIEDLEDGREVDDTCVKDEHINRALALLTGRKGGGQENE